jgi:glycosyltransferase involved in cell wall biosynthesis
MMAAYFAGVPNRLHTVAGLPLMESTGFKKVLLRFIEKLTYRFATKIYPNSKGLKDYILKEKFSSEKKLSIIGNGSSNGIDTSYFSMKQYDEAFQKKFRKELQIPVENFVFIFVGRLVKDKGIVELINAFLKLENKNSSLLLVGPLEQELDPLPQNIINTIQENSRIVEVGYQQDVRPYFAISNALVFPSYREGFPNVVLQALSMELPAIVSNINGCNEIVTHKLNGLIFPKKNEKNLEDAMFEIINNEALYYSLKLNTRTSIVNNYERHEIWNTLLKEYQSLITEN